MTSSKTVIIMRHARAEALRDELLDIDRHLTATGTKQAKKAMRFLDKLELVPNKIVSSHYVRALQTAEHLVKQARKLDKSSDIELVVEEALALAAPMKKFTDWLTQSYGELPDVTLIVSHEPNISRYLGYLLSSKTSVYNVKKGSLAIFTLESPTNAKLNAFVPPKLM